MKKTALITGATGGIGIAFARELSRLGWHLYLPVRDLAKPEAKELMMLPNAQVSKCDVGETAEADAYLQSLRNEQVVLDLFVLCTGDMKWDKVFPGDTTAEKERHSIDYHWRANVATKQNIFTGLETHFSDQLADMVGITISSWAAHFGVGHKFRTGEVGYVVSKEEDSKNTQAYIDRAIFKRLILKEPGRINTKMIREQMMKIGESIDWSKEKQPEEFVAETLQEVGL